MSWTNNSSIVVYQILHSVTVAGYKGKGIQGYRDTGIQGYMDTGIHGYYRDTGIL